MASQSGQTAHQFSSILGFKTLQESITYLTIDPTEEKHLKVAEAIHESASKRFDMFMAICY